MSLTVNRKKLKSSRLFLKIYKITEEIRQYGLKEKKLKRVLDKKTEVTGRHVNPERCERNVFCHSKTTQPRY